MDRGELFIQQSFERVDPVWKLDFPKVEMYLILILMFGEFEPRVESGQEEIRPNFYLWVTISSSQWKPPNFKERQRVAHVCGKILKSD